MGFTVPMEVIEDENLIGAINDTMVGGAALVECKRVSHPTSMA